MIKNIIFDVGKVLVEWAPEEAMRALGMEERTVQAVADATVRSSDWDETDRGMLSNEELLARFTARAPQYEKEIRLFWDHIGMAIYQFDYVKDWMRRFRKKGYRMYILSNYGEWTYQNTQEALSFLSDVDGAVFSYQVKQMKPEAEIYQTLLHKYALEASECVFLDDRAENIEGARAQGMAGIVFTSYEQAAACLEELGVSV